MNQLVLPPYYPDADYQLARAFPGYRILSLEDRLVFLNAISRDYIENGHLGVTGIEIASFIVAVVGLIVGAGLTIYQVVKQEKSGEALSRQAEQAAAIHAEATKTSIQANALQTATQAEEERQKKSLLTTGGILAVTAAAALFLTT